MHNTNIDLHIVFDNGGGITLMAGNNNLYYSHYYDSPTQAADDYKAIIDGSNPIADAWEGNEPEAEMDYDYDVERNGGYRWFTANEIDLQTMKQSGWQNVSQFASAIH